MSSSSPRKPSHPAGQLSGGPSGGRSRKIDTWEFYATSGRSVGKKDKDRLTFEVFMLDGCQFRVENKTIPPERFQALVGSDLAKLHAQAEQAAIAEHNLQSDLVWSDWLEITIRRPSSTDRRDAIAVGMAAVSYRVIPRAEDSNGTAYTAVGSSSKSLVAFPQPIGAVEPSLSSGFDLGHRPVDQEALQQARDATPPNSAARLCAELGVRDTREAQTQYAYLPDTPTNRAGLDSIILAITQVNDRLRDFLSPDKIVDTLQRAQASAGRLLSPPSEPSLPSPAARSRKP
jgi:hypothetical protein